ncbi:MAG TPA: polysaccharide biosynthesis/export family protein [Hyphomicrobium zavarzinii]|nr:polysaccharide biosynthesis/export family protein [Hyphomicrobium zavarzinii]
MGAGVTAWIRFLSCAAALALAGCAHDPETVISAALTNMERQGSAVVFGDGPPPAEAADQVTWGPPAVHPAGYGAPMAAPGEGPYLLDTGDRLRVFVYGQPNLSRAYTVDQEGQITVPLIGEVRARGRTARNLEDAIRQRLAVEYVRDPQVTVDILQNRPFFIYGEVKTGGQYPYISGMTVETAIAVAGGYSERASTRSFRITRRINGFVEQIEAPNDFPVLPGDVVYVNERFF